MKENQNIEIQQGDDETLVSPIEDADSPNREFVQDLSEYTFTYVLTDKKGRGTVVLDETDLTISTDEAQNISSAALDATGIGDTDDVVIVEMDKSDTKDLAGTYWHELDAEDSNGNHQSLFRGKVVVERGFS